MLNNPHITERTALEKFYYETRVLENSLHAYIFSQPNFHLIKMHFVLESTTVKQLKDIERIIYSYKLREMLDASTSPDTKRLRSQVNNFE